MSAPFVWFDLSAANTGSAGEFYRELFGWVVADADAGDYRAWILDGSQPWAGVVAGTTETVGRWVPYVVVDELDDATKRAMSLGASVIREATEGPAGTSVVIADPGGAQLALFVPAAAQQP